MLFKKRKYIYAILTDFSVDYETTGSPSLQVFKNRKKAYKAFLQEVDKARYDGEDFENRTEDSNLDISKYFDELPLNYYQIYTEGDYTRNHIEVQLIKQQLQ